MAQVIVISDTSPISGLLQIGRMELLQQVFGKIIVPPVVDTEIRKLKGFSIDISSYTTAAWVEIVSPNSHGRVQQFMQKLDAGESEAIVFALEQGADLLLIDERAGNNIALAEGLTTIGLIGVLVKAKESGHVKKSCSEIRYFLNIDIVLA